MLMMFGVVVHPFNIGSGCMSQQALSARDSQPSTGRGEGGLCPNTGDEIWEVLGKMKTFGDRRQVWLKKAVRTRAGLIRSDLKLNKSGTVVSIKKSNLSRKKSNLGAYIKAKKKAK